MVVILRSLDGSPFGRWNFDAGGKSIWNILGYVEQYQDQSPCGFLASVIVLKVFATKCQDYALRVINQSILQQF